MSKKNRHRRIFAYYDFSKLGHDLHNFMLGRDNREAVERVGEIVERLWRDNEWVMDR